MTNFTETIRDIHEEAIKTGRFEEIDNLLWACEDLHEVSPDLEIEIREILAPLRMAIGIGLKYPHGNLVEKAIQSATLRINKLLSNLQI